MIINQTEERLMPVVVSSKTICDKCGKEILPARRFDAYNFTFEVKTGTAYPEGGSGEKVEMDLCEGCAVTLVDILTSQGYRLTKNEWSF